MGIKEQIQAGARFNVGTVTLGNSAGPTGRTDAFGQSYMLLNVTVNNPCRIRLYSDSASVAIDNARPTSSMEVSASVGLVLDTQITQSSYTLYFDPPIVGTTFQDEYTWFNISGSDVTATFTRYPIEAKAYSTREALNISAASIAGSTRVLGDITSPKSFLILSASCNHSDIRLRLYSRTSSSISAGEQSRAFSTLPSDGSYIITDMVFDSASYSYILSPTLQAFNLTSYTAGSNLVGYILENLSGTTKTSVSASLYIYSIED